MTDNVFELRLCPPADEAGARIVARAGDEQAGGALRLTAAERARIAAWWDAAVAGCLGPGQPTPAEIGAQLFAAAFDEGPLRLWRRARDASGHVRLALAWERNLDALAALPWELLFDCERNAFVADRRTAIVRRVESPAGAAPPREVSGPLRLLAVAASAPGADPLDVAAEFATLREVALTAGAHGWRLAQRVGFASLDLRTCEHASLAALTAELAAHRAEALHVVAHGGWDKKRAEGALLFEGDGGEPVGAERFAALLEAAGLRLVVLNACSTGHVAEAARVGGESVAAALVRRGVPAVVALQGKLDDRCASALAHTFYAHLLSGASAERALHEARLALRGHHAGVEWAVPALYVGAVEPPPPRAARLSRVQRTVVALDAALGMALALLAAFLVPGGLESVTWRDIQWAWAFGSLGAAIAFLWSAATIFAMRTRQTPPARWRAAALLTGAALVWLCLTFTARADPAGATQRKNDGDRAPVCPALAFEATSLPQPAVAIADAPIVSAEVSARFTVSLAAVYILVPRASEASRDLIVVNLELYWPPRSDGLRYRNLSLSARAVPGAEALDGWPHGKRDARPAGGALSVTDDEQLQTVPDCPATIPVGQCAAFFSSRRADSWRLWSLHAPPASGCARATLLLRVRPDVKHLNLELRRRVKLADEVFGRTVRQHELDDGVLSLPLSLAGR